MRTLRLIVIQPGCRSQDFRSTHTSAHGHVHQAPHGSGRIPSSLEPDTIQPPGGSNPVGADALALADSVPTDGNKINANSADGSDKANPMEIDLSTDARDNNTSDQTDHLGRMSTADAPNFQ